MQALLFSITQYSYFGIFIALGLGIVGLPLPDETLMAYAGFLVFQGKLNYFYTMMVAFMGTTCGITIGYALGRGLANPLKRKYFSKMHVNQDEIQAAEKFYNRYGKYALFICYFIPGIRHLTAIFAGTSRMPYRTFAMYAYPGGFLWTMTMVSIGYFLGEKWRHIYMYSHRFIIPLVLLSVIIIVIISYRNKLKARKE